MSPTPRSAASEALVLRTAALWGTFVLASRDLHTGQSLEVGDAPTALFAKLDETLGTTGPDWAPIDPVS